MKKAPLLSKMMRTGLRAGAAVLQDGRKMLLGNVLFVAWILVAVDLAILQKSPSGALEWDAPHAGTRRLTQAVTVLAVLMLVSVWLTVYFSLYEEQRKSATPATILVLCVLILVVYSFVYTLLSLYRHYEDHFTGLKPHNSVGLRYFDMVYFTATTMSTVGYGDICPLSYFARAITITQYSVAFSVVGVILSHIAG